MSKCLIFTLSVLVMVLNWLPFSWVFHFKKSYLFTSIKMYKADI